MELASAVPWAGDEAAAFLRETDLCLCLPVAVLFSRSRTFLVGGDSGVFPESLSCRIGEVGEPVAALPRAGATAEGGMASGGTLDLATAAVRRVSLP